MVGGSEILLILLAILVLFGADKLPEFARGIGKGMREFKKATDDIKREITDSTSGIKNEMDNLKNDMQGHINEIKTTAEETNKIIPPTEGTTKAG